MTKFGTAIFTEMTLLAQEHDAINLGQGAPDNQAPAIVHERAIEAIRDGHNQYAPDIGIPELREAIAHHQQHHYDITLDPATQVQASAGAAPRR
ncbi:aminotransferase class I/II-fold pyridoxal phosphate-dependent enzyme [Pseudoclavibacter albus]|uniref:aminotransferase class I/II-fold pyridoxal phosphate-dependent enzyme n=1 Tax=Pseudoclavibacter albus TaxID=272241 RepID=UPI00277D0720|nr:aminotransferase class I/II-fold pyridoxal phosphate-dependent enzyme [Pseudoclavibacter alba]